MENYKTILRAKKELLELLARDIPYHEAIEEINFYYSDILEVPFN